MTPKKRRRFVQSLHQLERRLESEACHKSSSRKRDTVTEMMQVHNHSVPSDPVAVSYSANPCMNDTTVDAQRHSKEIAQEMCNVASAAKKGKSPGTLSCLNDCADSVSSTNVDGTCDHGTRAFVQDSGVVNDVVGVNKSIIENDDTSPNFLVNQELLSNREDTLMVKNSSGKREFLAKDINSQVSSQCVMNVQQCQNVTNEGIALSTMEEEIVSQTGIVLHDGRLSTCSGDSSCPIVFSANWNPWDVGRATRGSESIPPPEFLATPLSGATPLSTSKSTELGPPLEFRTDGLNCVTEDNEDIRLLCDLLGVTIDSFSQLHVSDDLPLSVLQDGHGCAVKHEQPGSLFYVNVAKVEEQNSNHAKCIDDCLEQLSKSQEEPYSAALLLIAKASLQNDHNSCFEFPQIVAEWLQS